MYALRIPCASPGRPCLPSLPRAPKGASMRRPFTQSFEGSTSSRSLRALCGLRVKKALFPVSRFVSITSALFSATANGVTSSPFSLTTRKPNLSVPGTITNACDSTWGYLTTLNYTVKDQLNTLLPSHMPTNEDWTTGPVNDYNGTNWRQSIATGFDESGSAFADAIGGENLSLPPNPVPTCDGNSTSVQHWGQEWRVGSTASGFGSRIQTDTLQKYVGHAAHVGIVSPAP